MEYLDVLKRAWKITWKYKALWILGLFAGTGTGSSGGGNSGYRTGSNDFGSSSGAPDAFSSWMSQNWVAFAIVAALLVIIGIGFWILSVAAQGGLVWGANEAAEDRKPSLGRAWSVGFGKWGRTFMIGLVLGLPVILIAILFGVTLFAMVGGGALLGSGGDASGTGAGAALGAIGGVCFILPIFLVLIVAASVVIGIIYPLALRYGVLNDVTFGQAIKRGWGDIRAKRGAFVFWLIMLLPGFAVGILTLLLMLPFAIPAFALFMNDKFVIGGALLVLAFLILMVPMAIYGTFVSSAWTIFFRKMTGLEPLSAGTPMPPMYAPPAPPTGYAPPAPPTGYAPPAPPAGYAAPAPPVVREPMAPPVVAPPTEPPIVDVPDAPPAIDATGDTVSEEAPPADE